MMAAGAVVAGIGALVLFSEHRTALPTVTGTLPIQVPVTRPGHVPIILVGADLVVQFALTGLGLTLGCAVLRQGILVERRLPQRGYLSHWRGMALVAGVLAAAVAWMTGLDAEVLARFAAARRPHHRRICRSSPGNRSPRMIACSRSCAHLSPA